jgi:large subunit ribosomal protein L15
MNLHTLKPNPGSKHRVKRLGCGESSGHGKTSGKGHKGQKARSGGSIRLGFEGGQMPLIRRLPKRGFSNAAFRTEYAIVNLGDLNVFADGATVDEAALVEKKLIRRPYDAVKVLGVGKLERKLTVSVHKLSASARAAIEAAGGTVSAPAPKAGENA